MRKRSMVGMTMVLMTSMLLAACGQKAPEAAPTPQQTAESVDESGTAGMTEQTTAAKALDIMFVVTGNLGGGTNNDDVHNALENYAAVNGGKVSTFECNMNTSVYETTLMQAAETGEYDLIVTGFGTMIEPLGNTAVRYPNQKFLIFDTAMDFSDGKNQNVMSVQVQQNQGCFLAGALAAMMTTSTDCEFANDSKVVGFVGAIESTAVLDSLVSYIEGVNYIDSSIEVLYSFVGSHTDSALTKEVAMTQNSNGADVIFCVSNSDLAAADAALEKNFYAICVDADEAMNIAATSEATAEHIPTSVIKAYDNMVYPIVEAIGNGTAEWGTHKRISYADGGVSLADNKYYEAAVPAEIRAKLAEVAEKMKAGDIQVSTAYGASTEDIDAIKDLAASH